MPTLQEVYETQFLPNKTPTNPSSLSATTGSLDKELASLALNTVKTGGTVSPALEADLARQGQTLNETLRKRLGTGYDVSSPGIEALGRFNEGANLAREESRRQLLGQVLAATQGRENARNTILNQALGYSAPVSLPGVSGVGDPLGGAAGISTMPGGTADSFGQVAQGYSSPLSWYQGNRAMDMQAQIANQQSQAALFSSIFGALGTAGGIWAGGGFK